MLGCLQLALHETNYGAQLYIILAKLHIIRFTKKIRIQGSNFHANSLESGAEEDEKKNGILLFSPQQITARKYVVKRSKNPNRL